MDAVRKAYQRAVQIPMDNVKKLWEEYQDFENGLNRITVGFERRSLVASTYKCLGEEIPLGSPGEPHAGAYCSEHASGTPYHSVPSPPAIKVCAPSNMAPSTADVQRRRQGADRQVETISQVGGNQSIKAG